MVSTRALKAFSGIAALLSLLGIFFLVKPVMAAWLKLPIPTLSMTGLPANLSGVEVQANVEQSAIIIPKLGINTPIVKDVSVSNQKEYDEALKNGVALAQGTAGLEASAGNSFLFGHSSSLSGNNSFTTIFAALPTLQIGDSIQISVGGRLSPYSVTTSKSVSPSEVGYIKGSSERTLTLLTCWPPGTTYKRWIVQAEPAT